MAELIFCAKELLNSPETVERPQFAEVVIGF